jgi:carboxypeptidase Taq
VNKQSSNAILADLKYRLSEIYDLNAAGSVLTWDEARACRRAAPWRGLDSRRCCDVFAHERFVDPALGSLINRLEPYANRFSADDASLIRVVRRDYEKAIDANSCRPLAAYCRSRAPRGRARASDGSHIEV